MTCPKFLNRTNEVGAVRLSNEVEHSGGAFPSELPVESARKRLFFGFAALKGSISHGLGGTGAAYVDFGGGCRALHPLIPKLLNIGGQRRWAGRFGLWRGWPQYFRRGWLRDRRRDGCVGTR
jgi:hypothetical protein